MRVCPDLFTHEHELSHSDLLRILDYDRNTGKFTWKVSRKGYRGIVAGALAGSLKDNGQGRTYHYIRIDGIDYLAQRLAWFYVTGHWPATRIEFEDGNRLNICLDNLREGPFKHGSRQDGPLTDEDRRIRQAMTYRRADLKRRFSIDIHEYERMHDAQTGLCAICGKPETQERNGRVKWLGVDHNHNTDKVRDLLCSDCNNGIERFHESIELLEAAIAYLRRHMKDDAA